MTQSKAEEQTQQFQEETPEDKQPKRKRPRKPLLLIPLGLVIAGGLGTWYWLSRPVTDNLQLSGRIEGYETDIGTEVSGRVEAVTVREGAQVEKGQPLVKLNEAEIQAQLNGANARLKAAQERAEEARGQIEVFNSQIREARLNLQQSQGDTQGRIAQADAQVATAQAQLQQAKAQLQEARSQLKLAQKNRDRFAFLVKQGAVAQERFDQAQTRLETAQATLENRKEAVNAAQRQVNAAQGQLAQASSTNFNPDIRQAQIDRLNAQLEQARRQLAAAQAEVENAKAAKQEIQAKRDDLNIASPEDGIVTTRSIEPGTVVNPGRALLTVLDFDTVYLRGYIPEGDIGKVRVGQPAQVYLDSAPEEPISAHVAEIDSTASFTPENIYFQKDRVQQVFGVKLEIDNPEGFAKPGMPADAEIVLEPNEAGEAGEAAINN